MWIWIKPKGITDEDENTIHGTYPNNADSDGDGMNNGDELAYWGSNWNIDYDGDRLNNLLAPDAGDDGSSDLMEIYQGYDPTDPDSQPPPPFNVVPILDLLLFEDEP